MSFCSENIIKKYGYIDNETLMQAHDYVKAELAKGLDATTLTANLRQLMKDVHGSVADPFIRDIKTLMKLEERIVELSRPEYTQNPVGAFKDWIFKGTSMEAGTGTSVENLKGYYRDRLVHSLDMAIISRDPELPALMAQFTEKQWADVRRSMSGQKSGNQAIDTVAELFVNHNKMLFAAKDGAGLEIAFNEDYGFRRKYNGEKITSAGFKDFSVNLLNSLDLKKSRLQGVTKENIERILTLSKKPGITDAAFEAETAFNPLLKEVLDDYENWTKNYDPFSEESINSLMFKERAPGPEARKQRQFRSYIFKDADSEIFFMKNYGEHGENIYKYIKGDARSASTELAFTDKFGPNYNANYRSLLDQAETKAKLEGISFNRADAEEAYNLAAGRIIRAPHTLADVHNFEQGIAYGADVLKNVTSMATLSMSAITQLLDLPQTAFMYANKSNENMLKKWGKLIYHSFAAIPDAFKNDPKYAAHIVDLMDKTMGEIDAADLRRSAPGKGLDWMLGALQAKRMNKYSAIINIRLLEDLLKNSTGEGLKSSEKFLAKFGLTKADMIHAAPLLTRVDSPMDFNGLHLDHFKNNPRGMEPLKYRETLSKGMYLFVSENFKQGSPTKGLRQVMDTGVGTDRTKLRSSIMGMIMQFKGIPYEMMQSARQLNNLNGQFENKILNGTYLLGSNLALMSTGVLAVDYLKSFLRSGGDLDKTNEDFFREDNYKQKILRAYMRGGAFSFLTEPFSNVDQFSATGNPITKFVATPSVTVPYELTKLSFGLMMNTVDDQEYVVRKKQIKELYKATKLVVPGFSALSYIPVLDVKSDIEEQIIEYLDSVGQ